MRHSYIIPRIIDPKKVTAEAYRRAHDTWGSGPESTTIHYHKFGSKCTDKCTVVQAEEKKS